MAKVEFSRTSRSRSTIHAIKDHASTRKSLTFWTLHVTTNWRPNEGVAKRLDYSCPIGTIVCTSVVEVWDRQGMSSEPLVFIFIFG